MKNDAEPYEIFSGIADMVDQVAEKVNSSAVGMPVGLVVHVEVDRAQRGLFLEVVQANAEGSRTEPGC